MRKLSRRVVPLLLSVVAAMATATCSDAPVNGGPTAVSRRATLSIATSYSAAASRAGEFYRAVGLIADKARVVIVRPPSDTLKDTTFALSPTVSEQELELEISAVPGEIVNGGLTLSAGNVVLFSGTGPLTAYAPATPVAERPHSTIALVPVAPGVTAKSVSITPGSGLFPTSAGVALTAHAIGQDGLEIPNAIFVWTSSDPSVAVVTATGGVQPTAKGGSVTISAATLNGVSGSATITFFSPPARIVTVSGSGQTGEAGSILGQPFVVEVQAANGNPVPSQSVVFSASAGGSIAPVTVTTGTTGRAQAAMTLGGTVGSYGFAATAAGFSTSVTASAIPGPSAAVTVVSGDGQSDTVTRTLKNPLVVRVVDKFGNVKAGVAVTWTRTGSGTLSAAATTTDANGVSSIGYTLGTTAGVETISATAAGVTAPAVFNETAIPPAAAGVTIVSGNGQAVFFNTALPAPLVIQAVDAQNKPVAGAAVAWAAQAGKATLQNSVNITGADGQASTGVVVGPALGPSVVTATVNGKTASFTVTALAGAPANLTLYAGGNQSATAGTLLPNAVQVRVTDAQGNPAASIAVAFAVATGGGAVTPASAFTDANGIASASWTLGPQPGTQTMTATRTGLAGSPVTVTATATGAAPVPVGLQFVQQPTSAATGAIITPAMTVRAVDGQGQLVSTFTGNVTLAFGANPGTATLGGTLTRTAVGGVATFNDITVSAAATGYTLVATSGTLASATSTPFNVTASGATAWTGAVSTAWATAGNWTSGVPGPTSNVTIPSGTPNAPTLAANVSVANLTVGPSATLVLGTFSLTASGSITTVAATLTGTTGGVISTGSSVSLSGNFTNLTINGIAGFAAPSTVTGTLTITTNGTLSHTSPVAVTAGSVVANGALTVGGTASLATTTLSVSGANGLYYQLGGTVTVSGSAVFAGTTTSGFLIGGTLDIGGNFTQTGTVSSGSFTASGTHRTVFSGAGTHTITFANPVASNFQDLELDATGTTTLGTAVSVQGQLISTAGATPVVGNGNVLTVSGVNVDGMTLDNTLLVVNSGTLTKFDNVTFQNYAATATPFTISHPGQATPFVMNNVQFLVTPTTGNYISATDNLNNTNVLTLSLIASVPTDGSAKTIVAGGAVVNWVAAAAGVNNWLNASGGSWSQPTNWSLGRAPVNGDSVVISLNGTYTVTLDTTYTGTRIVVGGGTGTQTLAINNRTLTMVTGMTILAGGRFSPTTAAMAGPGTITNNGTLQAVSTTFATPLINTGTLNVDGAVLVSGAFTSGPSSTINLVASGSTGIANFITAAGWTNNGAITMSSVGSTYSDVLTVSTGTLTNSAAGTITTLVGTGGGRSIDASIANAGTITVNQPLVVFHTNGTIANTGVINVPAGGGLTFTDGGSGLPVTNSGAITLAPGVPLVVSNTIFNHQAAATLNGGGDFTAANSSVTVAGPVTLASITATGGSITFQQNISTATTALSFTGLTVNGPGIITNAPGKTLLLNSGSIAATSGLVNQGTFVTNTVAGISGPLTTTAGSAIQIFSIGAVGASSLTVNNGFTNNGTIDLTSTIGGYGATLTVNTGTLVNASTGQINALPGTGGGRALVAAIDNQGTITVTAPLDLNRGSSVHANNGTINVSGGDLTITQTGSSPSFTNNGTITIAAGHLVTVSNGTFTHALNATLTGQGTFATAGSSNTVNFVNPIAVAGLTLLNSQATFQNSISTATLALSITGSTINGPGTITNAAGQTMTLKNSVIAPSSALANLGTLHAVADNTINGPLTTAAASLIQVYADGSTGSATMTVQNGFTNNGAIELTSTIGGYSSALNVTVGTLTNAAGASIAANVGTGGTRSIGAELANAGVLTVNEPLTLSKASANHSNSGTFDVIGADLSLTTGFSQAFSNTGTINIQPTRTLTTSNTTFTEGAGGATITGGGTISFLTGSLNLTGDLSNATVDIAFNAEVVNGFGTLTNAVGKTLTAKNVTFAPTSTVINQGTLLAIANVSMGGTFTTATGSVLSIYSDGSTGSATMTASNSFTNNGTILLTSTVGAYASTLQMFGTSILTNAATANFNAAVGSGGSRVFNGVMNNLGTIGVSAPLTFQGPSGTTNINSGTITVSGADFTLQGTPTGPNFNNSGTITIGSGLTFAVNNTFFQELAGSTVAGGSWTASGSTLRFFTNFDNSVTNFSATNTAIQGTTTITNIAGKTLTLKSSTMDLNTTLVNQGTLLVVVNATLDGNVTTAAGSTIRVQSDGSSGSAQLNVTNALTNNGTIDLTSTIGAYSSAIVVSAGSLTNAAAGSILASIGTGGARTIDAVVANAGSITVSAPLTFNRNGAAHTNSGTIDLVANDLTLSSPTVNSTFTNSGTLTIPAGRTLGIQNATFIHGAGGGMGGGGSISATNGSVQLNAALSTTGVSVSLNNSTLNGTGTLTNAAGQTMTLKSAVLNAPVFNSGTIEAIASNVVNGTFANAAGSTLDVYSDGSTGTATLTFANALVNSGTINLTSTIGGYGATLSVGTNTFTNATGGSLNTLAGTGGARTVTASTINNDGTITVNSAGAGSLTLNGSVVLSSGSVVNMQLGGLTAGTTYDQIAITGSASFGGTLNVSTFNAFTPATGNAFTLFTAPSYSGSFGPLNVPGGTGVWTVPGSTGTNYTITRN